MGVLPVSRVGVGVLCAVGVASALVVVAVVPMIATRGAPPEAAEVAPVQLDAPHPPHVSMRVPDRVEQRRTDRGEALPSWFGLADRPARRIAGRLCRDGAPVAGTIHLRIEAPDATIWRGVDIDVGPDGWFDFGDVRAGRYYLLAIKPGETSRTVLVDTREAEAEALGIDLLPCTTVAASVRDLVGEPIAGAAVDLVGVVIARTARDGTFHTCFLRDSTKPVIRAEGYAAQSLGAHDTDGIRLAPTIWLRGHVTAVDGDPAAGVAVEPVRLRPVHRGHSGRDFIERTALPVQAVTSADGSFLLHGIPAADFDGYGFRVISHAAEIDDRVAFFNANTRMDAVRLSMAPPPPAPDVDPFRGSNARISGQVLRDGRPVAGAVVRSIVINFGTRATHTRADGSFALGVLVSGEGASWIEVDDAESAMDTRLDLRVGQTLTDLTFDLGR